MGRGAGADGAQRPRRTSGSIRRRASRSRSGSTARRPGARPRVAAPVPERRPSQSNSPAGAPAPGARPRVIHPVANPRARRTKGSVRDQRERRPQFGPGASPWARRFHGERSGEASARARPRSRHIEGAQPRPRAANPSWTGAVSVPPRFRQALRIARRARSASGTFPRERSRLSCRLASPAMPCDNRRETPQASRATRFASTCPGPLPSG